MESLWNKTAQLPKFKTLTNDCKTDVLIIGAGITGILTAYHLHQAGVNYILVDKGRMCGGVTGNTTAKITYQHNLIYNNLLKNGENDIAKMYLSANMEAFDKYKELCKSINCDYEIKNSYVYSINNIRKIEKEIEALNKIGYNAQFRDTTDLPFEIAGAVCFPNQAQFHPLKFISHISKNLNIYENTFVRELSENTAITDKCKITAKNIIVTTHFPFLNKHGAFFLKLYQERSYVIALENAQEVNGIYIDENPNGLSFRNYKNMLLIGGGSHRTGKGGGAWETMRKFAAIKYPAAKEICHWATQDCISLDGMPYIGHYSKRTANLFTACGFNKWGMTGSMLAASLLCDMILEKQNDYLSAFTPSRSILQPQLLINGFEAIGNLLTFSEKRCPHLGCALKWNQCEHTWDCPCHGSRFEENGKLIDNPSNGDLQIKAE